LVKTSSRGSDLAIIKNFEKKFFIKIFGSNVFPRKCFPTIGNLRAKIVDENFWVKSVFEEMILQTTNFRPKHF
jgi:hypothetical protein